MEQSILVVEDTPFYGRLMVYLLSCQNLYQTQWANTGHQALLLAQQSVPLLFLLDYRLPDMTGIALYDRLHALVKRERVPALLLSADFPSREIEEQLTLRKISGMRKPFKAEEFLLSVERLIKNQNLSLL
jgi:CheY-like chemotaxis protein